MYRLIQTIAVIDDRPTVIYGMECSGFVYPYISESKSKVLAIVDLCNRYEVDPVHAEDVAEDYLYS